MLETAYPSGRERTLWEQLLGSDREKQKKVLTTCHNSSNTSETRPPRLKSRNRQNDAIPS